MNETVSPAQAIEELRRLCENARKIFGAAWLDEAAFYQGTVRLRLSLPAAGFAARKADSSASASTRGADVLRLIDNFEQSVEGAKTHLLGKVAVNESEFLQRLQNLENALRAELGAAYETPVSLRQTPPAKAARETAAPPQNIARETLDYAPHIAQLRHLCESAPRFLGKEQLDEGAFYTATTKLRIALVGTPASTRGSETVRAIDALAEWIEKSTHHYFGRVLVNEREYLERVQTLENALRAQFGAAGDAASTRDDASPFTENAPFENR